MRPPFPHRSPPRKDFCRAKMPCGGQVFQICCSAGKSSDFLQTSGYLHARKRVLPKYVEDCPIGKAMQIWNSRDLKRAAALLFPKESRGNPFKGFLWAISSRRLDTALLCAAKKRGVEKNQLAGLCQNLPWATGPAQKSPCRWRRQKKTAGSILRSFPSLIELP